MGIAKMRIATQPYQRAPELAKLLGWFRTRYAIALFLIAALTIVGQGILQTIINARQADASVIELAGQQRALSQKIAEVSLQIAQQNRDADLSPEKLELAEMLDAWRHSHHRLASVTAAVSMSSQQSGAQSKLDRIQTHFDAIDELATQLAGVPVGHSPEPGLVQRIVDHEVQFSRGICEFVDLLNRETQRRLSTLRIVEWSMACGTLILLLAVAYIVFEPTAKTISDQFTELDQSRGQLELLSLVATHTECGAAVVDGEFRVLWVNDSFTRITGYSADESQGKEVTRLLFPKNTHAERVEQLRRNLMPNQGSDIEFWCQSKSRSEYWSSLELQPVSGHSKTHAKYVLIQSDISDRKQAEAEQLRLNEELAKAIDKAGSADVAAGVLHNMANVLTSVHLSANQMREILDSPAFSHLQRTAEVISEHQDNLVDFLTNDSRGKNFTKLVEEMARSMKQHREAQLAELDLLAKCVTHMTDIVKIQQADATKMRSLEASDPGVLMDDAIKMNQVLLDRNSVRVFRDYQHLPPIDVVGHEVMQILINLIKNARQSVSQVVGRERMLFLSVKQKGGKILFDVTDNGLGIDQENRERMFQFGFTTKNNGHGIGLHRSAAAAEKMGGRLKVKSDGLEKGASFTLELPMQVHYKDSPADTASHSSYSFA